MAKFSKIGHDVDDDYKVIPRTAMLCSRLKTYHIIVEFAPVTITQWVNENDVMSTVVVTGMYQNGVQNVLTILPTWHNCFVHFHSFSTWKTIIQNIKTIMGNGYSPAKKKSVKSFGA